MASPKYSTPNLNLIKAYKAKIYSNDDQNCVLKPMNDIADLPKKKLEFGSPTPFSAKATTDKNYSNSRRGSMSTFYSKYSSSKSNKMLEIV